MPTPSRLCSHRTSTAPMAHASRYQNRRRAVRLRGEGQAGGASCEQAAARRRRRRCVAALVEPPGGCWRAHGTRLWRPAPT